MRSTQGGLLNEYKIDRHRHYCQMNTDLVDMDISLSPNSPVLSKNDHQEPRLSTSQSSVKFLHKISTAPTFEMREKRCKKKVA